jgi:hypothetical protein
LDNNIFLEGRLHTLSNRKTSFFAGAGYHFSVDERSDIYLLAGVSQPVLPSSSHLIQKGREFFENPTTQNTSSQLSPAGGKLNLNGAHIDSPNTMMKEGGRTLSPDEIQAKLNPAPKKQSTQKDTLDKAVVRFKSKLAPSLEVGYRANISDEIGVRLAYRLTQDNIEINHVTATGTALYSQKGKGMSNELSAGAHYHFTPQLAAEVGYTFTKLTKVGFIKPKGSHMGTVGLRYAFN